MKGVEKTERKDRMERRKLNGTDLEVSRICMGTMTFGGQADERTAAVMVDCCLERGIDFFDTANVYTKGQSEEIVGRILKGRRDRVILASKVGLQTGEGAEDSGLSQAAIVKWIEASLRRLQTDYLDIYYMHAPDYQTPIEESLEAMAQLVRQGKVRYVGVSNYASWQVCRMLGLAEQRDLPAVRITQPMYNLLTRGIEQEFLPMCREFGLSMVVYNPLAGGLLTGKHRGGEPEANTRFDLMANYQDRYWHDMNFAAVEELAGIADQADRSLIGLAFGWLLHHTTADCLILGASRLEQLQENLELIEAEPLDEETVAACDRVWAKLRGVSAQYNR